MSRVVVRGPRPSDRDEFLAAARRSRAFHRRWGAPPTTAEQFRAYLRRHRSAQHEGHVLVERTSGALLGVVNVMEIVRGSFQGAYLGYYLEANIQPENLRSIRLVERVGFRREGYSPRYLRIGGRWRDHEGWAVVREEWVRGGRAAAGARS
jgi:ribosomal-protein-alanine N-acetyltransferase